MLDSARRPGAEPVAAEFRRMRDRAEGAWPSGEPRSRRCLAQVLHENLLLGFRQKTKKRKNLIAENSNVSGSPLSRLAPARNFGLGFVLIRTIQLHAERRSIRPRSLTPKSTS